MEGIEPLPGESEKVKQEWEPIFSKALAHLVRRQIRKLLSQGSVLTTEANPENIHEMRIALRRLLALLDLFTVRQTGKDIRRLKKGLRGLGKIIGPLRDLDVFMERALGYSERLNIRNRSDMDLFIEALQRERGLLKIQADSYFQAPTYGRLKDGLNRFAALRPQDQDFHGGDTFSRFGQIKVIHVLPALLFEQYGYLRALGEPRPSNPDSFDWYHSLRIGAKKLRYVLEFFQPYLGPGSVDLIARTKRLQDLLGTLQDSVVAIGMIRRFLETGSISHSRDSPEVPPYSSIRPVYVKYLATCQSEIGVAIRRFPTVWQTVGGSSYARRLANILGSL